MENDLYTVICNTARLLNTYGTLIFKENTDSDLESLEYRILRVLVNNSNLSQQDLSSKLLITKAHAGFILTSLEKKGYITRIDNKKNGKFVKISIPTEKGIGEYNKVSKQLEAARKSLEQGISEKRKELMISDLKKIQLQIEKLAGKLY